MSDIESKVGELIRDSKRLERLLALEKQRRGLPVNGLAFIGMHSVAQHWWCTQQAVLKSRANEMQFFSAYLYDRMVCANRLGLVDKLPRRHGTLLDIGGEITLADVEKLLKGDKKETSDGNKRQAGAEVTCLYEDTVDKVGRRRRLINPDLPEHEKRLYGEMAEAEDALVMDLEEDPLRRGTLFQASRAEKHSTVRWSFPWGKYAVIGVPDGLTEDFVYEYKTTRNRYLLSFVKPVALAQADLYGYFFQRSRKRVQIQIVEESNTETYEDLVNTARAEETLAAFARVDGGEPAHPPKPWKCRACEFRVTCPLTGKTKARATTSPH